MWRWGRRLRALVSGVESTDATRDGPLSGVAAVSIRRDRPRRRDPVRESVRDRDRGAVGFVSSRSRCGPNGRHGGPALGIVRHAGNPKFVTGDR